MKSRITYASTRVFPIGSRIWRPERDCPRYSIKFKELIGTPVQSCHSDGSSGRDSASGDERNGGSRRAGVPGHILFSRQFKQYTGKSPSEIR